MPRALVYSLGRPVELPSGVFLDGVLPALPGEPNGYENRDDVELLWNNAGRTLTVRPRSPATEFAVWADGERYVKNGTHTIQITDVEGTHYIYWDVGGALTHSTTPSANLIKKFGFTCVLYWDAVNQQVIPNVFNETHGAAMPAQTHYYLHNTQGTAYGHGLQPSVTATGAGSLDSHCQVALSAGSIFDEDIQHSLADKPLSGDLRVIYRVGTAWRMGNASSFLVLTGANGRALWNDYNGGNWQTVEAASGNFLMAHLYAMPGIDHQSGTWAVLMGQAVYSTASRARQGAITEITNLNLIGLPSVEFRIIATLIIETKSTFNNTVKSRIVQTDSGDDYVDWRRVYPLTLATTAKLLSG